METVEIADLRNLRQVTCELHPGLNVFVGRNAQGKTTLLEAVGLLARGRSFRTDDVKTLIRRGAERLVARGTARDDRHRTRLEVEVASAGRRLRVDGRDVTPGRYHGRLEVAVYSTDRLRVVRGPMRERRQFVDRAAGALWPAYRQVARDYERVVRQRNAALEQGARDRDTWDERLCDVGARLRHRRAAYVERLRERLDRSSGGHGEHYDIRVVPGMEEGGEAAHLARLQAETAERRGDERRARRSLVGPHRDPVELTVDGQEAALFASAGQARSLLLALTLAVLDVYEAEQGQSAVALLDDLDSELDEERATRVCATVAARGQALVTTAHESWARRLAAMGRVFSVEEGRVSAA
ncbi:MAG TPA: DNA replication and repair protein RecF [Vicinamibacteria bacterium]|nr:DNA replication and repair protein RecF [Vicinamibacteria bacterium]